MKTSLVWRNCYLREIDIPDAWMNKDVLKVLPLRQDLFWLECTKSEVREYLIPLVQDKDHVMRIKDSIASLQNNGTTYFLVNREVQWIQYWPYMSLHATGSLWEPINEVIFPTPEHLKTLVA
jgi:hypothetical protein